MIENLTLCHVLVALAALDLVAAILFGMRWMKYSSELRGTPIYARGRDARRVTIALVIGAVLMLALAYLTPLGGIAIS